MWQGKLVVLLYAFRSGNLICFYTRPLMQVCDCHVCYGHSCAAPRITMAFACQSRMREVTRVQVVPAHCESLLSVSFRLISRYFESMEIRLRRCISAVTSVFGYCDPIMFGGSKSSSLLSYSFLLLLSLSMNLSEGIILKGVVSLDPLTFDKVL